MEFNFRAVDDRPPNFYPPPSNFSGNRSFFSEEPLLAGYIPTNVYRRNNFYQNGMETPEIIQRELEKERIREAIIAAEIARKRMVEAEVRRDMIIQREIEIRREADYSMFAVPNPLPHEVIQFNPRFPRLLPPPLQPDWGASFEVRIGHMLENRYNMSIEDRISCQDPREYNKFNNCQIAPLQITMEDAHMPEENVDLTHSRRKRKAVTLPAVGPSAIPSTCSKKLKEEWSCALCQVITQSEKTWNDHLQSKKHMKKAAGLMVHKEGTKLGNAPLSIKLDEGKIAEDSEQKIEQPQMHKMSRSQQKKNRSAEARKKEILTTGVKLQVDKPEGTEVSIAKNAEDLEKKTEQPPMQKLSKAQEKKKKPQEEQTEKIMKKETCKYWCEMCKVKAHSEVIMIAHNRGKKHLAQLKLWQNCDNAPSPIISPVLDSAEKKNDAGKVNDAEVAVEE